MRNNRRLLTYILLVLLVVWIGVIFFFSSETPERSTQRSGYVYKLLRKLNTVLDFSRTEAFRKVVMVFKRLFIGTAGAGPDEFIRSSAHFGFYAIFGFVTALFFWLLKRDVLVSFLLGVSLPSVVAILDEYNQAFHRRQSTVVDAFVDLMGAISGTILAHLLVAVVSLIVRLRKRKERDERLRSIQQ